VSAGRRGNVSAGRRMGVSAYSLLPNCPRSSVVLVSLSLFPERDQRSRTSTSANPLGEE
jgi:hypothetical protein